MNNALSIVMYHYVRPIAGSRYPRLCGLELSDFEGQLDYLLKHYNPVSVADVVRAHRGEYTLPENPVLLTFDDGYTDHYNFVMPALLRRGMTGVFFPPSCSVEERKILDVHKIHFIVASVDDSNILVKSIEEAVEDTRNEFNLDLLTEYRSKFFVPNRFDTAEINYVKRMLQVGLPEALRGRIASQIFHKHVSKDESSFADELYVSTTDLGHMLEEGMEIGSHGHAHNWLNSLSIESQAQDIDRSLEMLTKIGVSKENFYFCYPYGGYNEDTLNLLSSRGCAAAFTTQVGLAEPCKDNNLLELPRLDTNDLPINIDVEQSKWTRAVKDSSKLLMDNKI